MAKTSGFYSTQVLTRLEQEFRGVYRLMDSYYSGINPYRESIQRNLGYLADILSTRNFSRLRRRPRAFVGGSLLDR